MSVAPRTFPQGFHDPAPSDCQVLLVRHGQSQALVEGQPFPLVDGQGNPPLSPRGQWQAEQVGARLAKLPITAIWVSTLERTSQTAAPLVAASGITPNVDADLREVHVGVGEGGLLRMMRADGDPNVVKAAETGEWGLIPGAETSAELRSRTVGAVERIARANPGGMVAVFCHGGVIMQLAAHATGGDALAFRGVRNASITHVYVNAEEPGPPWTLRTFNDASHIGPLHHDTDPTATHED